jgi:hypothetical protein
MVIVLRPPAAIFALENATFTQLRCPILVSGEREVDNVHHRYEKYYFRSEEILLSVDETRGIFDTVCAVKTAGYYPLRPPVR